MAWIRSRLAACEESKVRRRGARARLLEVRRRMVVVAAVEVEVEEMVAVEVVVAARRRVWCMEPAAT